MMTILLELVGCTGWTRLSDGHSCRLTSLVSIPDSDLEPTIPWSGRTEHYLYNTTAHFDTIGCRLRVIADDTLKDLLFEEFKGSVVEFHWGEDAVSIEPSLKAGIYAIEIKEGHPLIDLQNVCMIDHIEAVRLMGPVTL
jgi:hypothetical protein